MIASANAPCSRGSTVATASLGSAPRSISRATICPTTSVSVWLAKTRPSAFHSSRYGLHFSLLPLCTTITSPLSPYHTSELLSLMLLSYAVFCFIKNLHHTTLLPPPLPSY